MSREILLSLGFVGFCWEFLIGTMGLPMGALSHKPISEQSMINPRTLNGATVYLPTKPSSLEG